MWKGVVQWKTYVKNAFSVNHEVHLLQTQIYYCTAE